MRPLTWSARRTWIQPIVWSLALLGVILGVAALSIIALSDGDGVGLIQEVAVIAVALSVWMALTVALVSRRRRRRAEEIREGDERGRVLDQLEKH